MKEFFIGEVLKKRRIELGLTQEQVCEGIFSEPSTLSRIENGVHPPTYRKLLVLLQRLGLPGYRYYALVDKNELEISELQAQITYCNIRVHTVEGLSKIDKLESLTAKDDFLSRQFILRSKVALGKIVNGQTIPYSFDERIEMLFSAIHLTCPQFDINNINHGLYCIDEIKVINQIALTYSNIGKRKISLNIYSQLFTYIQAHLWELHQAMPIIILVAYNYSRDLCFEERIEEATKIAHIGIKASIESSRLTYLGGLLFNLAYCLHKSGKNTDSENCFYRSYSAYSLMNDPKNARLAQKALKELFNVEVKY